MSTSDKICKDGASKSSSDDVCGLNDMLQNMSTADKEDVIAVSVCANCGKEGDINNICNKCKLVKYCNAACKKKHRHKHKKDCEEHVRQVAERAAELHDIELFKQPPPNEDCPICFIQLPSVTTGRKYQSCCGKVICGGCSHAPLYDNQGNKVDNKKCPFCRVPTPTTNEETTKRLKNRVEVGDPIAIYSLACDYRDGTCGYPQDITKALELWHRAAELGYSEAYVCIGYSYYYSIGVEVDKKKAKHYYELAAMGGNVPARHNLGNAEYRLGNIDRAIKHYMIAAEGGEADSLTMIQQLHSNGDTTKDSYTAALRAYQKYMTEIKSAQRDEAAAADEECRYY